MGQQIILEILIDVRILVLSSLAGFCTSIKQVSGENRTLSNIYDETFFAKIVDGCQ